MNNLPPTKLALTPQQKLAAFLFAIGNSLENICEKLELDAKILNEWCLDKVFMQYVLEIWRESYNSTIRKAIAACGNAIDFLEETMKDPKNTPPTRLAAAKTLLTYADAYKDFELEMRLADIEKQLS